MNGLLGLSLFVGGFTASAEFGSVVFVHPAIRKLAPKTHLQVEQGLLNTFGRAMPFLMTSSTALAVGLAVQQKKQPLLLAAALSSATALSSTILLNVPINQDTATWNADEPPADWKATRNRWEVAQGVRASLFLLGFALTCVAASQAK